MEKQKKLKAFGYVRVSTRMQVEEGYSLSLIDLGAAVIVIEHDLDVIRNADYIIDMGPGGGLSGGRIIAEGTPEDIRGSNNCM
ncbi:hypothetical protein HMPREF7215_0146 [Pyramidobacter piscolens W5455]|uniref:UvrABC system protein A n=1 Tax=Pyramidobacter piscolens W5455 TaxID=352165 RepID=A0ABM9ZRC3_9BACT|nr:excinuclease ABC, A subunit [Pyramidobacter piscolens]EFB89383.1 hypothetical protein HMPREF7215_0146 [Pyramidobacter piscolens W5455]